MSNGSPLDAFSSFDCFMGESIAFLQSMAFLHHAGLHALGDPNSDVAAAYGELAQDVAPTYGSPVTYFATRLFVSHIAAFEAFLHDLVAVVIGKHPMKVGATQLRLSDVLDADSIEVLVRRATEETLARLMYKKPSEYLTGVCDLLSISSQTLEANWKRFVEAKARRDLGVHNGWICNAIYLRKLAEVDIPSELQEGESAIPRDHTYLVSFHSTLSALAREIYRLAIEKHWPTAKTPLAST